MTSAWSITRSANPPRAAYLDFPLGHTTGKPRQPELNRDIIRAALQVFETATRPGEIVSLPFEWAEDDAWKDGVMRPRAPGAGHGDSRVERLAQPQYQTETDKDLAERALASGGCPTCVWIEPES